MADVQLENGYTKIANEILDAIQHFQFSQNQFKILIALWRNTYGWNRKECEFSLSHIEKTTNLDRKRASATLKSLIEANVIIEIDKGSSTKKKVVVFNKNYEEWNIKTYKGSGILTTSSHFATSGKTGTSGSGETTTSSSGHSATHKRNIKEILNKSIVVDYDKKRESGGAPATGNVQLADEGQSKGQIPQSHKNPEKMLIDKYMQLAAIPGFDISEYEKISVRQVINEGVPIEIALQYLEECFRDYKPKHVRDKINSFNYCATYILNKYFAKKEANHGSNDKVLQHRSGNGRSAKQNIESITGGRVGRIRTKKA